MSFFSVGGNVALVGYDLCVYGANPGGLFAAIAAARLGAKVAVFQYNNWIGGMMTGGLSATDINYTEWSALVVGIANDFFRDVAKEPEISQPQEVFFRNGYAAEPHVFERVLRRYMQSAGVTVYKNSPLYRVKKSNARITEARFGNYVIQAHTYIDGTYEGDLIAMAGCSVAIGREANATYGESFNGVRPIVATANFDNAVDPYVIPGVPSSGLLPGIWEDQVLGAIGSASPYVMAMTYRLCVTQSAAIGIPMPEPDDLSLDDFELMGRQAAIVGGGWTTLDAQALVVPLQGPVAKYDWNSGSYAVGTNYVSPECTEYITASYARREQIAYNVKQHVLKFFRWGRNDARLPVAVRNNAAQWKLTANEFEDYGGFSPQLYVREGRRLVGDFVLTELDLLNARAYTDGVSVADYGMDSHHVRRILTGGLVKNEGYLLQGIYANGNPIPFRVMKPKVSECTNLLATFAVSATHTAFSSLRMEPDGISLGEAAGIAAYIASQRGIDVAFVDSSEVQGLQNRFRFNVPGGAILAQDGAAPFNMGTVTTVGVWNLSPTPAIYGHAVHAVSAAVGASKRFQPKILATGGYDVYALYVVKTSSARSSNAPFVISHAGGVDSIVLNQNSSIVVPANSGEGGNWVYLGRFTFNKGNPSVHYVEVQTDGVNQTVIEQIKWEAVK